MGAVAGIQTSWGSEKKEWHEKSPNFGHVALSAQTCVWVTSRMSYCLAVSLLPFLHPVLFVWFFLSGQLKYSFQTCLSRHSNQCIKQTQLDLQVHHAVQKPSDSAHMESIRHLLTVLLAQSYPSPISFGSLWDQMAPIHVYFSDRLL